MGNSLLANPGPELDTTYPLLACPLDWFLSTGASRSWDNSMIQDSGSKLSLSTCPMGLTFCEQKRGPRDIYLWNGFLPIGCRTPTVSTRRGKRYSPRCESSARWHRRHYDRTRCTRRGAYETLLHPPGIPPKSCWTSIGHCIAQSGGCRPADYGECSPCELFFLGISRIYAGSPQWSYSHPCKMKYCLLASLSQRVPCIGRT